MTFLTSQFEHPNTASIEILFTRSTQLLHLRSKILGKPFVFDVNRLLGLHRDDELLVGLRLLVGPVVFRSVTALPFFESIGVTTMKMMRRTGRTLTSGVA